MLVADKVQNCKDFNLYVKDHSDTKNSDRLSAYFQEWLDVLGVSKAEQARLEKLILL